MGKLRLNDASFSYEMETSAALGFGFRCGFLGLLHLEIIQERLSREFDLNLIATAPSVIYKMHLTDGQEIEIHNPVDMPDVVKIADIEEQYCLGAVYDVINPHGELCFLTRLHISLAEVLTRTPEDDEVKELLSLAVTRESLRDFLVKNHGNISATGEPNLLMYGGWKYGEEWLGEVMEQLDSYIYHDPNT